MFVWLVTNCILSVMNVNAERSNAMDKLPASDVVGNSLNVFTWRTPSGTVSVSQSMTINLLGMSFAQRKAEGRNTEKKRSKS